MVSLFQTNGNVVHIKPVHRSEAVTAKHIRSLVGNAFHLLPLDQNRMMIVQADAPKATLSINHKATTLFLQCVHLRHAPASERTVIRGTVLVTKYQNVAFQQILASAKLTF